MHSWPLWMTFLVAAYLVGSLPFGLWIGLKQGVDIRTQGSGNIGATNVGRVVGRKWGLICFGLDVGKGLLPTLTYGLVSGAAMGELLGPTHAAQWVSVGAAALLGHVFPIWLKFKGGKGVATGLGVTLGLFPVVTLAGIGAFVLWVICVQLTGYVSVGSIVAAVGLPILTSIGAWGFGLKLGEASVLVAVMAMLGLVVIIRHLSNLRNLRQGKESMVGWSWRGKKHAKTQEK